MLNEQIHERQQPVFAALSDPTRRKVVLNLAESNAKTATQLAQEYPITRQGILKHLKILEAAGLVTVYQVGREKRYTLTPEPFSELQQWVAEVNTLWEQQLHQLKAFLESE